MNVALRPPSLNLISLCTGGGGLDLGVELAIPTARSVVCMEREAVAVARLATAMEEGLLAPAPIWSDVRTFDGRPWRGIVDGLIGGIPCQPHSVAGQQLGEEDERDLWAPARRIIVQARPWFVLIENVEGMLHTGGLERLCRHLRRLRFEVEVGLFSASECGATHQRNRLFVLAVADPESDLWRPQLQAEGAWRRRAGSTRSGDHLEHAAGERCREGGSEPVIRSGRDSVASAGSELADASGQRGPARISGSIGPGEEGNAGQSFDRRDDVGNPDAQRQPQPQGAIGEQRGRSEHQLRWEPPARQFAFDERNARRSLFPPGPNDIDGWRYTLELWPEFEPAVRRLADGVVGRVDQLRMLGNGVVPLQAAYAVRTLATRLARRASGAERLVRMMELAA